MPSCLIVELDGHWVETIRTALASEGWPVAVADSPQRAISHAEPVDLVFVASEMPDAASLLWRFSRRNGSSCSVVLLPRVPAAPPPGVRDQADGILQKPFDDAQLWACIRSVLSARIIAGPTPGAKLTSEEIFGDMLAELSEPAAKPVPAAVSDPSQAPPASPPPSVPRPRPSSPVKEQDDIDRKLEETLSGILDASRLQGPKPAQPPRLRRDSKDIDKLLSDTLSGLNLGSSRPGSTSAARPAPSPAKPGAPVKTSTPGEASRPPEKDPLANLDFSFLDEPLEEEPVPAAEVPEVPPPPATEAAREGEEKQQREPPLPQEPAEEIDLGALLGTLEAPSPPVLEISPHEEEEEVFVEAVFESLPTEGQAQGLTEEPAAGENPLEDPELPPPAEEAASPAQEIPAETTLEELLAEELPPLSVEPGELELAATEEWDPSQRPASRQFGHYTLLERIAVGGMAEVWKARMDGVAGFQKTVAIKKILSHLTENEEFERMFVDEARLAAELNHPNITHIYDLGVLHHEYYIAMEYVEGKNLRGLLTLANRKGLPIPHDLALLIASRLASALDYAHRKRDAEDRELGLVHRDVSPQNVLISYEGDIKLCDFGIVKAFSKLSKTEIGALKGKIQYMSPEQAWGREVDARSDIFSLGSLLFEMLTGLRLFAGDSELSVLDAVRACSTRRPRDFDPTIPDSVDDLVAKAVAENPADRFPSADRMRGEIESILEQLTLRPSNAELATYLRQLLAAPDVADSPNAGPTGKKEERVARFPLPVETAEPESPETTPEAARELAPEPAGAGSEPLLVEAVAPAGEIPSAKAGGRRWLVWLALLAAVILAFVATSLWNRRQTAAPPPAGIENPSPEAGTARTIPSNAEAGSEVAPGLTADGDPAAPAETDPLKVLEEEKEKIRQEVARQLEEQERELRDAYESQQKRLQSRLEQVQQEQGGPAQPPAAEIATPGPGVKPPVLVSIEKPQYPADARPEPGQQEVVLYLLVDTEGRVEQVRQIQGMSSAPEINQAAIEAARTAKFKPALKEGRRVKMWTTLKIPIS